MEIFTCYQCDAEMTEDDMVCPQCGASKDQKIPNYPRMGGGAFMVIWIFFVLLVVGLVTTWLANLN